MGTARSEQSRLVRASQQQSYWSKQEGRPEAAPNTERLGAARTTPGARERRAIARAVEDIPDARLLRAAVGATALLGITRVRRSRAEEGAVERLMAAPSELPQHLAVEGPSGPCRDAPLALARARATKRKSNIDYI